MDCINSTWSTPLRSICSCTLSSRCFNLFDILRPFGYFYLLFSNCDCHVGCSCVLFCRTSHRESLSTFFYFFSTSSRKFLKRIMFYSSLGFGWVPVCSLQWYQSPVCFRDCVCSSWTVTGWCLTDTLQSVFFPFSSSGWADWKQHVWLHSPRGSTGSCQCVASFSYWC